MEEKRQYKRIKIELSAQCKILSQEGISFSTKIIDIAPEGICLLANDKIATGTQMELTVELDGEKIPMKAKVVWADAREAGESARVGVKIIDIAKGDLEKFVQFYCQKLFGFLKSRKKILIVDDSKDLVDLLTYQLKKKEYEVVTAQDGPAGYDKYLQEWPDLIILDITLPKMNGLEVCRKIRREKNDTKTPIIMLTAKDSEEDKVLGGVLGAEKYITKPFDAEYLLEEVDKFLNPA